MITPPTLWPCSSFLATAASPAVDAPFASAAGAVAVWFTVSGVVVADMLFAGFEWSRSCCVFWMSLWGGTVRWLLGAWTAGVLGGKVWMCVGCKVN